MEVERSLVIEHDVCVEWVGGPPSCFDPYLSAGEKLHLLGIADGLAHMIIAEAQVEAWIPLSKIAALSIIDLPRR